ncbi:hypothetical protein BG004_001747 [Podila humilis]|nr:hypothetical protein BG004_001747 [Podila humilis]
MPKHAGPPLKPSHSMAIRHFNRPSTHYLSRVDAGVALHMAGFNPSDERLWLPRNNMIPPVELQRLVFPFIEEQFPGDQDRVLWIENIIVDRDVFHGRKTVHYNALRTPAGHRGRRHTKDTTTDGVPADDGDDDDDDDDKHDYTIAKRRHLILLAHLRKIVLQDAAVLMELGMQDEQCRYHSHHVFNYPVFKTQLLFDFRANLRADMLKVTSPITDSFVANALGIHSRLRSAESRVLDLSRVIETELGNTRSTQKSNERATRMLAASTSRAVGSSLGRIRHQIHNLRNESNTNATALKRMLSRISTLVNAIITEEISHMQLQSSSGQKAPDSSSNAQDALAAPETGTSGSSSVQHMVCDAASLQVPCTESTSMELESGPEEIPDLPDGAQSSLEKVDTLMSMIFETVSSPAKPLEQPMYKMLPRDSALHDI